MQFSSRVRNDLSPNEFFRAVEERQAQNPPPLDLTVSNPTLAGLEYPQEEIRIALGETAKHVYQPDPRGLLAARSAVTGYYHLHGCTVDPERIILTSGTSEAYSFLFKLLCGPAETVLYPKPSYPLVEIIAELEGLEAHPYPLAASGWRYDAGGIEEPLPSSARALVAVSPNNPTGTMLTVEEMRALSGFCTRNGLALIVDEVFLDYPSPRREKSVVCSAANVDCLTFTLGGLSKSCGLPQMKLAWIVVSGPEAAVRKALDRLEFIADAFLSVGTPVQQAAPTLLEVGAQVREQIRTRVDLNEATLIEILSGIPDVTLFLRDGGWYAVIGLPSGMDDEEFSLNLVNSQNVIAQPGYLFDFRDPQAVILSLLTPADLFAEGVKRISTLLQNHGEK
jgi:alanine-synthesizing transaminase